eukprot:CAMPEP_0172760724 /NCGR_PEP_ID=MMETSP1074-20121228/170173_1 /TAXON_ID=2916 /ORGANISM="Ceratium fusus, Strain PA161109" /LENGTH=157 /DNA_ID=CAMNT_0013594775 /DNA_START=379 /DNA_END=852 /DNA_ORIENTATION=+
MSHQHRETPRTFHHRRQHLHSKTPTDNSLFHAGGSSDDRTPLKEARPGINQTQIVSDKRCVTEGFNAWGSMRKVQIKATQVCSQCFDAVGPATPVSVLQGEPPDFLEAYYIWLKAHKVMSYAVEGSRHCFMINRNKSCTKSAYIVRDQPDGLALSGG